MLMSFVKRLYRCTDCGFQFHNHDRRGDAPLTDCPECTAASARHDVEREHAEGEQRIARMLESGRPPAVGGTPIARAGKVAEAMMSEMGMSDMNDGGRAGDRAAKAPPPMQTAEIHEMTRAMVEAKQVTEAEASTFADGARSFWQAGSQQTAPKLQQHINAASGGAAAARREGVDPIQLFHDAGQQGAMNLNHDVVAAVKG